MTAVHHIIHDIDRDGWGSAALLLAELKPEGCQLYPTAMKNGLDLLRRVNAKTGDCVWLLDIPTPASWAETPHAEGVQVIWVDHHPLKTRESPPEQIHLYLPRDNTPTTTMHLLVDHGIVAQVENPKLFVRGLCVPGFETPWTHVFDGLSETQIAKLVKMEELKAALASAPGNGPIPEALERFEKLVRERHRRVDSILDKAEMETHTKTVVIRLESAEGIRLKYFGLRAQVRFDRPVSIIVHRNRTLYCGRRSGKSGIDFLEHFEMRGLKPKGHPYVAFVNLTSTHKAEEELETLLSAIEEQL